MKLLLKGFYFFALFLVSLLFFQTAYAEAQQIKANEETKESIGPRPKENDHRIFLRQSSVLLKHKEVEIETGVNYQHHQENVLGTRITDRLLTLPLSFRLGLKDRFDVFFDLPFSYGRNETGGVESDQFSIGDLGAGFHCILLREEEKRPEMVLSFNLTMPTGKNPYENTVALGTGHWTISAGVLFIKSFDPVILFAGVDYAHEFERTFSVGSIQPGESVGYNFGLGFAVNSSITLNTTMLGQITMENQLNDAIVQGTSQEPISLSTGLTYLLSRKTYLEPSVVMGLNESAADVIIRFSFIKRF